MQSPPDHTLMALIGGASAILNGIIRRCGQFAPIVGRVDKPSDHNDVLICKVSHLSRRYTQRSMQQPRQGTGGGDGQVSLQNARGASQLMSNVVENDKAATPPCRLGGFSSAYTKADEERRIRSMHAASSEFRVAGDPCIAALSLAFSIVPDSARVQLIGHN
jgi:hypothetical protein